MYNTTHISFIRIFFLSLALLTTIGATAQKTTKAQVVKVHGRGTYTIDRNSDITLAQALLRCEENAKVAAIDSVFGRVISSEVQSTSITDDSGFSSTFKERTLAETKGDWLGNEKEPVIQVDYVNGQLVFTAEVWGKVREITNAKADITYCIYNYKDVETQEFQQTANKETSRIFLNFQSPQNGYLAVYLLDETDKKVYMMLPYKSENHFPVSKGVKYTLFNRVADPAAKWLNLSTSKAVDHFQLYIIFSPNQFTCNFDTLGESSTKLNYLSIPRFEEWLSKARIADRSMVVKQEFITVHNTTLNP